MEIKEALRLGNGIIQSFNGAITFSLWKSIHEAIHFLFCHFLQWGHNFFVMEIIMYDLADIIPDSLQWGHNFFVMEIINMQCKFHLSFILQWGHNFFVMEMMTLRLPTSSQSTFNGAITFSLWKFWVELFAG